MKNKLIKNKSFLCIIGLSLTLYSSITACTPQHETEITYNENVTGEINLNNEENYRLINKIKTMN
ncbi:MAG: hypothetical protein IKG27_03055 [Bacilli bacterium]|nr:hypothetical protein [Bacilli bacterium]